MNEWSLHSSISQKLETLHKVKTYVCVCTYIIDQVFLLDVFGYYLLLLWVTPIVADVW